MDKTDQTISDGSALELNRTERTVETVLRITSMALSIAGLVIMIKNSISNDFDSLSLTQILELSSAHSSSLSFSLGSLESNQSMNLCFCFFSPCRYLVNANGVCATYSLLSALFVIAIPCSKSKLRVWTLFLLDQVITYAVLVAGVVSAETVYLVYKGNKSVTWSSVCDYYGVFCHKALVVSVIFTFVVSILYMSLSLISSYRLFSRFEAPKQ